MTQAAEGQAARPGAWGRWGDDDQRGALNLVTAAAVLEALRSVNEGCVVSLALPLSRKGTPVYPTRSPVLHVMTLDGGDYEAGAPRGEGGFQFADDHVSMPGHAGTHVDALSHVGRHGLMYNGFPTTEVRSNGGARKLGIQQFGGLVSRALVLDVPAVLGVDTLDPTTEIEVAHLEAALAAAGTEIRSGDVVLVRTGWLDRYERGNASWFQQEPGIGVAAARWLAEHEVALIGADNFAVEVVPSPDGEVMPVHLICLADYGIHLMEFVDLRPLIAAGVSECLLILAPLPITGGVGSPVNPIAVY